MIIGGKDGVFFSGSIRSGMYEYFFPAVVTVGSEAVDNAFVNRKPIKYSASCRIRNVADTAWIDISDVTFFQVSGNKSGGGSANLTLRKPDKWNIDGTENPDLLRPSSRALQIFVTISFSGNSYTIPAFTGQIENYNESHGQSGGSISITAKSNSLSMQNRPTQDLTSATVYRRIVDELAASGLFAAGQVPVIFFEDSVLTTQQNFSNLLALIEGLAPVSVDIITRQSGGLIIQPKGQQTDEAQSFNLSDNNQVSINRSIGGAQSFNRITVAGISAGILATQTVEDAADIARRGVVLYPYRYGNTSRDLALNVADAGALLAESLRGKLSAQTQLNPFINVGTVLGFSSGRLFITNGRARVGSFTHSYQHGSASTQIYDMAVLA